MSMIHSNFSYGHRVFELIDIKNTAWIHIDTTSLNCIGETIRYRC